MDNCDMSIPFEILEVKSKNFTHLMNGHGCNDAGIVDLDPGDSMLSHECAPSYEKFRGLWQQTENRLKAVKERPACSGEKPRPFRFAGRVDTFQNSTKFCGKQKSCSPPR